jgi:hypothetical protein
VVAFGVPHPLPGVAPPVEPSHGIIGGVERTKGSLRP